MAGEWARVPLAELVDDIIDRRGVTPKKLGSHFTTSGYRVISAKVVRGRRVDLSADDPRFVDEATYRKWMKTPLKVDDVILTSEAPLGEPAYVASDQEWCLGQRLLGIRTRKDRLSGRFLYYALQSEAVRHELLSRATGTTAQGIRQAELRQVVIPVPDLDEQHAIAHTLGTLDDKIELNRRMNETLEAMARALFKSWFVDFEPVWAKAEGRDTGLPSRVEDLFPESVVTTELGEIPTGWGISAFSDTVDVLGGGTPKTSIPEYWNGDIPWFSVVDAPRDSDVWVMGTAKHVTQSGIENSAARVLPTGTTIISARGTVGRVALTGVPMAMNQSCYGIRGRVGANGYFTYFATRELAALLKQHAHGSVFDTITRDTLASVSVVSPPERLVLEFEELVAPILQRIRVNLTANRVLAELRDSLLPKLISGEIRARDAERLIGETSP